MVLEHYVSALAPCDIRLGWPVAKIQSRASAFETLAASWAAVSPVLAVAPVPAVGLARAAVGAALATLQTLSTPSRIKVTSTHHDSITCDKVILTVPISVLKVWSRVSLLEPLLDSFCGCFLATGPGH